MKRLVCWMLVFALALGMVPAAGASEPEGFLLPVEQVSTVPEGYKGIYTVEELSYALMSPSGSYILMADLDFSGIVWSGHPDFNGIFDGNGHVISGMTGSDGLFPSAEGAEIRNLGLENCEVSGRGYVGGIVDFGSDVTIHNCYYQGRVQGEAVVEDAFTGYSYSGGIAGQLTGSSLISHCWVSGEHVNSGSQAYYRNYPGGIAGYCTTIDSSIHSGVISSSGNTWICGIGQGDTISNCRNYGEVILNESRRYPRAGGVTSAARVVKNCVNAAAITVSGNSAIVGGVAAYCQEMYNCFNRGEIQVTGTGTVGGLIGKLDLYDFSPVECCYNAGLVSAGNADPVGSLIGSVGTEVPEGSVQSCYYLESGLPACGALAAPGQVQNVEGLTDEQMRLRSSFNGFDFDSVWVMPDSGSDYLYPILRGMPGGGEGSEPDEEIFVPVMNGLRYENGVVTVDWLRPLGSGDVDGYEILRKEPGGEFTVIGSTEGLDSTEFDDATAELFHTYTYTVRAVRGGEAGEYDPAGLSITCLPQVVAEFEGTENTDRYIDEHIWFAESESYAERMEARFAKKIALAQNSDGAQVAAEAAYQFLDAAVNLTEFQAAAVLENPYDALLLELIGNLGDDGDLGARIDTTLAGVSANVLELIYMAQPDYVPSDDYVGDFIRLVSDPDGADPMLYDAISGAMVSFLKNNDKDSFIVHAVNGSRNLGRHIPAAVTIVSDAAGLMDWFTETMQFYAVVESYRAMSDEMRQTLAAVGEKMDGDQAALFRKALEKYEKYMNADTLAEIFYKNVDNLIPLGELLHNTVGSRCLQAIAADFCVNALGCPQLAAAVVAGQVGWAISDALTGNDKLVASRTMIRANFHVENALYEILQDSRDTLLAEKTLAAAREFDAAYRLLRLCEMQALEEYAHYLDVSQTSFAQSILHLSARSNADEIALCRYESLRWELTPCHGGSVSDQHLGCNELMISGDVTVTVKRDGKTLAVIGPEGVQDFGATDVYAWPSGGGPMAVGFYADGVYELAFDGSGEVVVVFSQYDADMSLLSREIYRSAGLTSGVLMAEVYGKNGGKLELFGGEAAIPVLHSFTVDSVSGVARVERPVEQVLLDVGELTMLPGMELSVGYGVLPMDASAGTLIWSTSDPATATVDSRGRITAVAPGGAVITATTLDGTRLSGSIAVTVAPWFRDVKQEDYFFTPAYWAVLSGITKGDGEADIFNPDGVCTRAQVVTFLWRAAGCPEPGAEDMPFTDVAQGQWYRTAVSWAVEEGITVGTSATTFGPEEPCTRAQVATFLWRAKGRPAAAGENPFADVAEDAYYRAPVLWAVEKGITLGTGEGNFSPDDPCTRAQIVTFLYRSEN